MDGVEPLAGGYYLVTLGIEIKDYNRDIDMLPRLCRITAGQAQIVAEMHHDVQHYPKSKGRNAEMGVFVERWAYS
jgi:hypothetical protein